MAKKPLHQLGIKSVFLIWGTPHGSHRSEMMSMQLGADIQHIFFTSKRGKFIAPIKYFFQMIMTLAFLLRHRYQLIFVQDPPIFAVLPVYFYSLFYKAHFIIDSHTDALQAPFWKWSLPLHRFLEHRAITTLVTNEHLRRKVAAWGTDAFIIQDPPTTFPNLQQVQLDGSFNIVVVSTASYDEPITAMMEAANRLPDVDFYITGNYKFRQDIIKSAPGNVCFTGYVPDEEFYGLLKSAQVVMCLTTEDNTFLSGDNEALWLGKPLITSDWPLLKTYFNKGTIHVDNSTESICQAIWAIKENLPEFEAGILALQAERYQSWWVSMDQLLTHIQQKMGYKPRKK